MQNCQYGDPIEAAHADGHASGVEDERIRCIGIVKDAMHIHENESEMLNDLISTMDNAGDRIGYDLD